MPSEVSTSARGDVRPWITPTSLAEPIVSPLLPDAMTRGANGWRRPLAWEGSAASAAPASGSLGAPGARGAAATGAGGGGGLLLPQPATTNEVAAARARALRLLPCLRR